ncbi:uncharacterized protein FRV6_03002 [Fusarium oxysporum]|uniref:Uncharacterized protein n=1 Tax=Fusarium oxysporum TaxID=5507 RepID=A0A2H3SUA6_FUSOX|nr:uncharacterized protein FRV6_03002 [Fusarium oxysporum]
MCLSIRALLLATATFSAMLLSHLKSSIALVSVRLVHAAPIKKLS